ncbi:hypothetical protein PENSPDRAFT_246209 [Peniophora sp. CONT]|nr:hypothetical protein PENSPDRAFT_246209 [Peniophora sp. CONT]
MSSLSDRTTTPTAIFTEPLTGTPLQVYIHKDVPARPQLANLLTVHGGALATSISSVTSIIVDPTKASGQAVFRQHGAKKNKIVLTARWIHACIETQTLQTFQTSWAGCKVTGAELAPPPPAQAPPSEPPSRSHAPLYSHLQQAEAGPSQQPVYYPSDQSHPVHTPQVQPSNSPHPHVAQPSPHLPPQLSPHLLDQPLSGAPRAIGQSYIPAGQPYTHLSQRSTVSLNTDQRLLNASNHSLAHFTAPDFAAQAQPQTFPSFYPTQTPSSQHTYTQWQPVQQVHLLHHSQSTETHNQASTHPATGSHQPQVQDAQFEIRPPDQDLSQAPNPPPDHTFQNASPHGYDHQTQSQSGRGPVEWQPLPSAQVQRYEWPQQEPQQSQAQNEYDYYPAPPPQAFDYAAAAYNAPGPSSLAPAPEPASSVSEPTPPPVSALPSTPAEPEPELPRGRKRKRPAPASTQPSFSNCTTAQAPSRSPTPPTLIIPSPYGGHVFTPDDHAYLTRYIAYCSATGQILSLKEVCDKVAKKAGHHSVASWKRYANKKGFAVGEYVVGAEEASGKSGILPPAPPIEDGSGAEEEEEGEEDEVQESGTLATPEPGGAKPKRGKAVDNAKEAGKATSRPGQGVSAIATARARVAREGPRSRSPTPPRALFRSTTGKGVAFTDGDVVFLLRFLEYRNKPGGAAHDKSEFWAELARRAPHHSQTSWTKFYRRHREALSGNAPPPPPPEKRLRYSATDDMLLAQFWADPNKPVGGSDVVYQGFARLHPHHPWKGWQEHARLHKKRIEELVERIRKGENVDAETVAGEGA